jgi:hypothetical protein
MPRAVTVPGKNLHPPADFDGIIRRAFDKLRAGQTVYTSVDSKTEQA